MLFIQVIDFHNNKTHWRNIYASEWSDELYKADSKIDQSFTWNAQELLKNGYTKQSAQRTFAGKPCDMYTLTNSYGTSTYGLWNKIMLYSEVMVGTLQTIWEAQAVTLDVPEVAFTKTLNISWL